MSSKLIEFNGNMIMWSFNISMNILEWINDLEKASFSIKLIKEKSKLMLIFFKLFLPYVKLEVDSKSWPLFIIIFWNGV